MPSPVAHATPSPDTGDVNRTGDILEDDVGRHASSSYHDSHGGWDGALRENSEAKYLNSTIQLGYPEHIQQSRATATTWTREGVSDNDSWRREAIALWETPPCHQMGGTSTATTAEKKKTPAHFHTGSVFFGAVPYVLRPKPHSTRSWYSVRKLSTKTNHLVGGRGDRTEMLT